MSDTDDKKESPHYFAMLSLDALDDPSLPDGAKLLFARITSLAKSEGYAWAKNAYFAQKHNTSERTIMSWLKLLKEAGYIKIIYEYYPNSQKIKDRHIYPVIDPASKRQKQAADLGVKSISPPDDLVVKNSSPLDDLEVKKFSPPRGEINCGENNINLNNITAAVTDHGDLSVEEPEKPPPKAATAVSPDEIQKLNAHFVALNPKLKFDERFYPRALDFLSTHGLGFDFVSWLYKVCLEKDIQKGIAGYFYTIFFEERYVELFRDASRPPQLPPAVLVSCPVCGAEHDQNADKCPACGLIAGASPPDIEFHKKFIALPEERQREYESRVEEIFTRYGLKWRETMPRLAALKEEYGLTLHQRNASG